jgi:hypothetical protein
VRYPHLPPVGHFDAPELEWKPTQARSSRNGRPILEVWEHRWGGGSFRSVTEYLRKPPPAGQASAHVVYAGEIGPDAGRAAQLVPWGQKAWTECEFNATGISIEGADAIWVGHDPAGFARLARMTALLLHLHDMPAHYVRGLALLHGSRGFTRHADGLARGCGHLFCPTDDMELWDQFVKRVKAEAQLGGFRHHWGRA